MHKSSKRITRESLVHFLREEQGQAMTEYILIIGLIIIPIAAAFNLIRSPLRGYLERIAELFTGPGI